jgi:hypothetical protein
MRILDPRNIDHFLRACMLDNWPISEPVSTPGTKHIIRSQGLLGTIWGHYNTWETGNNIHFQLYSFGAHCYIVSISQNLKVSGEYIKALKTVFHKVKLNIFRFCVFSQLLLIFSHFQENALKAYIANLTYSVI